MGIQGNMPGDIYNLTFLTDFETRSENVLGRELTRTWFRNILQGVKVNALSLMNASAVNNHRKECPGPGVLLCRGG